MRAAKKNKNKKNGFLSLRVAAPMTMPGANKGREGGGPGGSGAEPRSTEPELIALGYGSRIFDDAQAAEAVESREVRRT